MSHQLTPPPSVKRSRDSFTVVAAAAVLLLLLGALACAFLGQAVNAVILAVLAVAGAGVVYLRLMGLRRTVVESDLEGLESPEAVDDTDEVGEVL